MPQCEEVDAEKCSDGVDHSVPQGVAADTEKSTDDVPLGDEVLAEKYAKDVHPNVQEVKGVTSKNAADEVEPLYDMPLDYAGLNEENVVAENISKFFDDFEDDNEEDEGYDDESEDYSDDDVNSDLDFVRNLSGKCSYLLFLINVYLNEGVLLLVHGIPTCFRCAC